MDNDLLLSNSETSNEYGGIRPQVTTAFRGVSSFEVEVADLNYVYSLLLLVFFADKVVNVRAGSASDLLYQQWI